MLVTPIFPVADLDLGAMQTQNPCLSIITLNVGKMNAPGMEEKRSLCCSHC